MAIAVSDLIFSSEILDKYHTIEDYNTLKKYYNNLWKVFFLDLLGELYRRITLAYSEFEKVKGDNEVLIDPIFSLSTSRDFDVYRIFGIPSSEKIETIITVNSITYQDYTNPREQVELYVLRLGLDTNVPEIVSNKVIPYLKRLTKKYLLQADEKLNKKGTDTYIYIQTQEMPYYRHYNFNNELKPIKDKLSVFRIGSEEDVVNRSSFVKSSIGTNVLLVKRGYKSYTIWTSFLRAYRRKDKVNVILTEKEEKLLLTKLI